MDRIEVFLALIVFLLAGQLYEMGSGTTPNLIAVPVLIIVFVLPLYLVGTIISENIIGR